MNKLHLVGTFAFFPTSQPGGIVLSVGHLTCKSEVLGSIPGLATYFSFLLSLIQEGQLSVTGESMCTSVGA